MSAAISHPSVVGLSERYVQLMLSMLRAELQNDVSQFFRWDEVIPKLVYAANTRQLKPHGYSPAQLLPGFQPKFPGDVMQFKDKVQGWAIAANAELLWQT